MSAASGMCGSSSGLAVGRCACDGQTCGDPAPARTGSLPAEMLVGERDPGLRGDAVRLLGRRPACPASRPAAPFAPHTPAIHAHSARTSDRRAEGPAEHHRGEADGQAARDVDEGEAALAVLGQALALDHPGRERREGAEQRGARRAGDCRPRYRRRAGARAEREPSPLTTRIPRGNRPGLRL